MAEQPGTDVAKRELTGSEKFTNMVLREFTGTMGDGFELTPYQRKLSQHLFLKVDASLKKLEADRIKKNQTQKQPIVWDNVNLNKLAIDGMHKIDLGLDALIDNHISPIPYWNSKLLKYDLDLRIGYTGKDYYRRKVAIDVPADVIYHLVYSTDKFTPILRSEGNGGDSYTFEITEPFERGDVVGGFGYIIFDDPRKNKLVLVQKKQLKKSESQGNADFWTKNPDEMKWKTVVHKTTDKLTPDPEKVNASFFIVEAAEDEAVETAVAIEIEEYANTKHVDSEGTFIEEAEQGTGEGAQAVDDDEPDYAKKK